ncbi:hypothetical protein NDU88_003565 [Pleurodeles waltl]|uniref:Uncharacterized protein n=1 Tax=Pleurodeles waltl TaxID=8319 RepID=A0AAV7RH32_PLEWA|nr:hypothetical protein NDU88_003565 [Pleurodeles waltl]
MPNAPLGSRQRRAQGINSFTKNKERGVDSTTLLETDTLVSSAPVIFLRPSKINRVQLPAGEPGHEGLQPLPRAMVFKEFSLLQQASTSGAQRCGRSAPRQRHHPAEQPRAQRPSPAPCIGPEPLLPGLRLRRGSVLRRQAPGGVTPLRAVSVWAADAAEEPAAQRAALTLKRRPRAPMCGRGRQSKSRAVGGNHGNIISISRNFGIPTVELLLGYPWSRYKFLNKRIHL